VFGIYKIIIVEKPQLTFSQTMNWIQKDAISRNLDIFFWMHADAVCEKDVIAEILETCDDWDICFTNIDALSATKVHVAKNIHWDEQFDWYVGDTDYYRRCRLAGYKIKNDMPLDRWSELSNNGVKHYAKQTRKTFNKRDKFIAEIRENKNQNLYLLKWGGYPGQEIYDKPYTPCLHKMRYTGDLAAGLEDLVLTELSEDINMIEIGTFSGEGALTFAKRVKHITVIDPWDLIDSSRINEGQMERGNFKASMVEAERVFDERLNGFSVTKIKNFDQFVVSDFIDKSIDFIYIDAIHTAAELSRQITMWLPKVKIGGKIGGHDYMEKPMFGYYFPEVKQTVDKAFGIENIRTYKDSSWIVDIK